MLIIGKFCSIACGAKFIFNCANHTLKSLSTYTFPLFFEEWDLPKSGVASAWDNKGSLTGSLFYICLPMRHAETDTNIKRGS